MSINQLWVEKYRPSTTDGYVFTDSDTRTLIEHWISDKSIPNVLFYGPAGTGKTTLSKILINSVEVEDVDVLHVNGSKEGRRIEWLRDKLDGFCSTMAFGTYKIVLIDEADYLNPQSVQPALRNLIESFSDSVRFILTCNWPHKIIPPLRSRCHEIKISSTDITEFTARAATVLVEENIEFDLDTLDTYVQTTYPDLRKCLTLLQSNSITGQLKVVKTNGPVAHDFKVQAVELLKSGRGREARTLICANVDPEEVDGVFRWAYDNLDLWSNTDEGQDEAIQIIKRGLINNVSCSDHEINLSATLTELISIGK